MSDTILVSGPDHNYYECKLVKTKVVFDKKYNEYSEYAGEDYLEEGQEVLEMWVAL